MTANEILLYPRLEQCVRNQAQSLLSMQEAAPRIASVFATQQRWLMAHAALAQYFRSSVEDAGAGLLAERFLELVERHDIASRTVTNDIVAARPVDEARVRGPLVRHGSQQSRDIPGCVFDGLRTEDDRRHTSVAPVI